MPIWEAVVLFEPQLGEPHDAVLKHKREQVEHKGGDGQLAQ